MFKNFKWGFLKSKNFWAGIFASILFGTAYQGIEIPPETPGLIWDAAKDKDIISLVGLVVSLGNNFFHIFKKKDKE